MVLRTHPPLRVFSAAPWLRGRPAFMSPTRPISISAVNMGWARRRPSGHRRQTVVIIREAERNSGLPIGYIILGVFFLVVAGGGYTAYKVVYKPIMAVWEAGIGAKDMAAKGIGHAAQKAQETSRTVQENLGPSLSKVSEELSGTIQGLPGAIGGAASGTKRVVTSYWVWAKDKVGGQRK